MSQIVKLGTKLTMTYNFWKILWSNNNLDYFGQIQMLIGFQLKILALLKLQ